MLEISLRSSIGPLLIVGWKDKLLSTDFLILY